MTSVILAPGGDSERVIPSKLDKALPSYSRLAVKISINRLDDESFAHLNTILDTFTGKPEVPAYAVVDIILLQDVADRPSMLEASAYLSLHTSLRRSLHSWFIRALMETDAYAEAMTHLYAAEPKEQQEILSIADAIDMLDRTAVRTRELKDIFVVSERIISLRDRELMDTILQYPDRAANIVDLFLERGSLEALDGILRTPQAVSAGAL